jgi:hypothetical protein
MSSYGNIDIGNGLSRSERFPRALHPDYFKIDERDTGALLYFTIELAGLFNYYNSYNEREGTWEDFFDLDMGVLLTLIARIDIKSSLKEYERFTLALQGAETGAELVEALNNIFAYLHNALLILIKTWRKANHIRNSDNGVLPVSGIVADSLPLVTPFIRYYSETVQQLPGIQPLDIQALLVDATLFPMEPAGTLFEGHTGIKEMTAVLQPVLNNLFGELRQKYSRLVVAAQYYLQHSLQQKAYDAHLGLYMAFLNLYGHLQTQMNALTERHLNFYYQQVLGIQRKTSVPDQVHIVCQLSPALKRFVLPEGELLLAEIAGTKETATYRTNNEMTISQAIIKELKTGFVSRQVQFPAGNKYSYEPIEEIRMYKGDYPAISPALFNAGTSPIQPWPLMGEDQARLPLSQRTMEDASLGLLLSSPLLYLKDGMRHIQVRFYLPADTYQYFVAYVDNFSGITGTEQSLMVHQLLSKAFIIHITGEEGWIYIRKYNLRFEIENTIDPYVELNFKLYAADQPVALYHTAVHGGNYAITHPAVKLEINNASFHNAFGFLRNMTISRVSIHAKVTGSREIQVQNNFGPLSAAIPFQPFGPLPAIGSYLDIKNTNIFNKFTRSFRLKIDWFDLPPAAGGFETYFKGYPNHIQNDSFTVSIAPLQHGKAPADIPTQQVVPLFNTWRDENRQVFLSKATITPELDSMGFLFTNNLLLNKEQEDTSLFKEGAIRIELLTPADAFGHRLFPVLFPEAIMHNAKRFVKKLPVPEQPYIPVIKSIEVDYVIEHSEVLKKRVKHSEESFLTLVHLYPFGHNVVYPKKETEEISLVPYIDQESNLLIGLQQVTPGQELSLLFEIREMKYHHTEQETEKIRWSYLQNNQWLPLKPSDELSDTTHGFIESGIVVLKLPDDLQPGNTILNPACCWIKASISDNKTAGRAVAVFTQAVAVTRAWDETLAQTIYDTWLPPACVKGFKRKIPEIIKTWQLFPSTGGRPEETEEQYNLRISERLRHKQRLLTSLDIAQAILNAFPEILMVKCVEAGAARHLVLPAINLQVIVVPREKEDGRFISREPGVSLNTLFRIKTYINRQLSVFANVEVGNPVYERIKIVCSVQIKKQGINTNNGYYLKLLNEDISQYINPWLYGKTDDLKIGGKIYIQDILDDIKKKPYVNYITAYSVLHFYKRQDMITGRLDAVVVDSAVEKIHYIEASRPDAVLIASDTHLITIIETPDYTDAEASGIGKFLVGDELTIYRRIAVAGMEAPEPVAGEGELIDIHIDF